MPVHRREAAATTLREQWDANAPGFIAWAREPGHDSYWRFHRDQFLDIVPPPGRQTIDIGCGEGRLSRDLKARGHTVIGVDASPKMIAAARGADPEGTYHLADAAALPVDDGAADLAIAFMSLQDIDDLQGSVREAARVVEPGGTFCVAIVHPLNSAGRFVSEEPDSAFVISDDYLGTRKYEDRVERDGLAVTFASVHRPLATYVAALWDAGFVIELIREPPVPDHDVHEPRQRRWQRIPLFLHLRARRAR